MKGCRVQASSSRSVLRYASARPGCPKLLCFPYAGGVAAGYRDWAVALSPHVDVVAVEYPGRGFRRREQLSRRIADLVQGIIPEIVAEMTGPIILFGHSMGALVAFEVLRVLSPRRPVIAAVMSGCRPPVLRGSEPEIHALPDEEFIEELRKLDGTPEELLADRDLMELAMPVLRADFEAVATYDAPKAFKLSCPLLVYGGESDNSVGLDELEGWREHAAVSCAVRAFPGNHFFVRSAEQDVLSTLRRDIRSLTAV